MSRSSMVIAWSLTAILAASLQRGTAAELPTAEPSAVAMDAGTLDKIDSEVNQLVADGKLAGAVVAVIRNGKLVKQTAYGKRDLAADTPMQTDTIFRIYSMSKPITTVAVMMLRDEGKFQLDDPVSQYLPEFKGQQVYAGGQGDDARYEPPTREMTIRDLIRHTSGIGYGNGKTPVDAQFKQANPLDRDSSLAEMSAKLGKLPLKFQPGTKFEYGASIDVLGRLVEVASGQPLDAFLRSRIFEPLGMRDTAFFVPDDKLERFATNYRPQPNGGPAPIDEPQTSRYRKSPGLFSGGGGLVSTSRDYTRFCQMLLGEGELDGRRLLKAETIREMCRNHVPDEALPLGVGANDQRHGLGFGLGFAVRMQTSDAKPASIVGECRWGGAASTHFWFSPQQKLAVVALQQQMPFTGLLEETVKPIVYAALSTDVPSPNPQRFASAIEAFGKQDQKSEPPAGGVVFVGSSSIRRWDLKKSFPDAGYLNRGFGGSQISDVLHFADQTTLKYRPATVVFYCGENDLWSGKSPEQVAADFRKFTELLFKSQPSARLLFLAVKPSPSRDRIRDQVVAANKLIRQQCQADERMEFLGGAFDLLLDDSGKPIEELFVGDRLHLSDAGYRRWAGMLGPYLNDK